MCLPTAPEITKASLFERGGCTPVDRHAWATAAIVAALEAAAGPVVHPASAIALHEAMMVNSQSCCLNAPGKVGRTIHGHKWYIYLTPWRLLFALPIHLP